MYKNIFKKSNIAGIKLNNKIIRSATNEGLGDENGYPTDKLIRLYENLAKNDVGAIITGYAGVRLDGKSNLKNMLMIDDDKFIESYKKLVCTVHKYNTPIILQIAHCGRQSDKSITGCRPVAPSSIKEKIIGKEKPKKLSNDEIEQIIEDFIKAIIRAKKIGFDGVQIHAAHGYLLSSFLSSNSNKRKDKWGGSTENKYRIIHEIITRARKKVNNYPILIKINTHDNLNNGMRIKEAVVISKLLEKSGCDAIETSCGTTECGFYTSRGKKNPVKAIFKYMSNFKSTPKLFRPILKFFLNILLPPVKPISLYNIEASKEIKKAVNIPVIVVGGIKSIDEIDNILKNKKADFASMSKPFIIEPNIVKKFKIGTQKKSKCINCNICAIAQEVNSIRCYYGKIK